MTAHEWHGGFIKNNAANFDLLKTVWFIDSQISRLLELNAKADFKYKKTCVFRKFQFKICYLNEPLFLSGWHLESDSPVQDSTADGGWSLYWPCFYIIGVMYCMLLGLCVSVCVLDVALKNTAEMEK